MQTREEERKTLSMPTKLLASSNMSTGFKGMCKKNLFALINFCAPILFLCLFYPLLMFFLVSIRKFIFPFSSTITVFNSN